MKRKFGSSISAGVRDIYVNINRWLDKRLEGWKPEKFKPMMFNGHRILASERTILAVPMDVKLKFLDILLELNVDSISFNIYPEVCNISYSEYDELKYIQ
ncbi:MAG: hypothetical protein DRN04_05560 [Thermoprotei archaeon]|nr:MAG: hypothetical protein DRN04_05560 [Thermoprotei archaeon]